MARKSKWGYKPESWKHMSKRNDYGCLIIIMIFCCLTGIASCCASCTKEEDSNSPIPDEVDEPKNTIDNIVGVWESVNNDLFFISISTQGRVSYCFNRYTMGIGHGTLIEKKLIIENDYSGFSDELYVENTNDILYLRGSLKKKGTNENESISLSFKKINEEIVNSYIGQFWKGLVSLGGGYTDSSLSFLGENIVQYKRYKRGSWDVSHESLWYYIPREHHKIGSIIYAGSPTTQEVPIRAYDSLVRDRF